MWKEQPRFPSCLLYAKQNLYLLTAAQVLTKKKKQVEFYRLFFSLIFVLWNYDGRLYPLMRTKQIMRLSTNLIENFFNRDILLTFLTTPYFPFSILTRYLWEVFLFLQQLTKTKFRINISGVNWL